MSDEEKAVPPPLKIDPADYDRRIRQLIERRAKDDPLIDALTDRGGELKYVLVALLMLLGIGVAAAFFRFGTIEPCGIVRQISRESLAREGKELGGIISSLAPDSIVDAVLATEFGPLSPGSCIKILIGDGNSLKTLRPRNRPTSGPTAVAPSSLPPLLNAPAAGGPLQSRIDNHKDGKFIEPLIDPWKVEGYKSAAECGENAERIRARDYNCTKEEVRAWSKLHPGACLRMWFRDGSKIGDLCPD